ncbi:insulin-related peptide 4-like [Vanessa atalanta]|uniref:insulin-related peptide 4-like n=1 Tax=Vanessa atalanta TaxID=42275 RepID=UPI001FCCCF3D|nr:insulin-related peptide 4-like [Vanessa atalanta]
MNFKKSTTLIYFVMMASMCCGHIGGGQLSFQDLTPQVYCGRVLAKALAYLCYDEPLNEKRTETGTMYNSILAPYYKEQENQIGWPWLAHHKARSMGIPRSKRLVVNECCDKACNLSELLSYC